METVLFCWRAFDSTGDRDGDLASSCQPLPQGRPQRSIGDLRRRRHKDGQAFRVINGGSTFVFPAIERVDRLSMEV